mmetsp:Transcript_16240/g.32912  ORF Transcript_16240/g.32912 Transcript_16240/m.32912 type:complete len:231 (+) Transcript_16240:120-812(+)
MCQPHTFKRSRNSVATTVFHTIISPACQMQHPSVPVRKSKKRVTMQNFVTIHPIEERSSQMTHEEKSCLFYTPNELASFSTEAKAVRNSCSDKPPIPAQKCLEPLIHYNLRGLELQISSERVRNKFLATKTVTKYQAYFAIQDMTPDQRAVCLAGVTAKMTRWSKDVAIETARLDSIIAYEGEFCGRHIVTNALVQTPVEISEFPELTKRRVSIDEHDDNMPLKKRVRCK